MAGPPPSHRDRDAALAAAGVPICPQCGERDMVWLPGQVRRRRYLLAPVFLGSEVRLGWESLRVTQPWCDRCLGYLVNLKPPPGRAAPDF